MPINISSPRSVDSQWSLFRFVCTCTCSTTNGTALFKPPLLMTRDIKLLCAGGITSGGIMSASRLLHCQGNWFARSNVRSKKKPLTLWWHIQQYGDWYTGRWWVGCYIWYSEEETGRAAAPPSPLLAVPNVTVHPSTPTSYYSLWDYTRIRCVFLRRCAI